MTQQNRYFVAIIPPNDISEAVTDFRNDFKNNYNSKAALKIMPHITLKAPFTTDTAKHSTVLKWFAGLQVNAHSFTVQLKNFGAFNNPKNPVVYVQPVKSIFMAQLQNAILTDFEKNFPDVAVHYHERDYNPHMTIAYRDLSYTEFKKAWPIYSTKQYNAHFEVTHFYLLQHNGIEWKIAAEYML